VPPDATDQATPHFGWDATSGGGRTVIAARGELDIASVEAFEAALREHLERGPVVLDLRGLAFMDSSGVKLLDAILRDADLLGWTFTVGSELPDGVRRLFDLTGITDVLPFEDLPDREERG
jgi:anti-anti-sigma factor